MHPLALKKVRFLKTHFLPLVQKKIFSYIKQTPGLSNNRIDRDSLRSHNLSLFVRTFLPLEIGMVPSPIDIRLIAVISPRGNQNK